MVEAVSIDPGSMPPALLTSPLRGVAAASSERDASDAFLTALESSSEEGANDGNQALEAGAGGTQETSLRPSSGGGGKASRKARIASLRKGGVCRSKEGHGEYGAQRLAAAKHASCVSEQRRMVRAVASREGFGVPLALRLVLLRRLTDVRASLKCFPAVAARHFCRRGGSSLCHADSHRCIHLVSSALASAGLDVHDLGSREGPGDAIRARYQNRTAAGHDRMTEEQHLRAMQDDRHQRVLELEEQLAQLKDDETTNAVTEAHLGATALPLMSACCLASSLASVRRRRRAS